MLTKVLANVTPDHQVVAECWPVSHKSTRLFSRVSFHTGPPGRLKLGLVLSACARDWVICVGMGCVVAVAWLVVGDFGLGWGWRFGWGLFGLGALAIVEAGTRVGAAAGVGAGACVRAGARVRVCVGAGARVGVWSWFGLGLVLGRLHQVGEA